MCAAARLVAEEQGTVWTNVCLDMMQEGHGGCRGMGSCYQFGIIVTCLALFDVLPLPLTVLRVAPDTALDVWASDGTVYMFRVRGVRTCSVSCQILCSCSNSIEPRNAKTYRQLRQLKVPH